MASVELIKAVAVTAELCGRTFSAEAAAVFVKDLERFPESAVIGALARCRREVKGLLTLADVISRLDDGRPGVEEAWAMVPKTEADSVVWTDEMCSAFSACDHMLEMGDLIAARMAFKEAYTKAMDRARDAGRPVNWSPSLGHDPRGHERVLAEAVEKGRLSVEHATTLMPELEFTNPNVLALAGSTVKRLDGGEAAA